MSESSRGLTLPVKSTGTTEEPRWPVSWAAPWPLGGGAQHWHGPCTAKSRKQTSAARSTASLRCHTGQTAPYPSQEVEQWPKEVHSSVTPDKPTRTAFTDVIMSSVAPELPQTLPAAGAPPAGCSGPAGAAPQPRTSSLRCRPSGLAPAGASAYRALQPPEVYAGPPLPTHRSRGPSRAALSLPIGRSSTPPTPCHRPAPCVSWSQRSTLARPVPVRALTSATVMACVAQAMMSGSLISDFISSTVM